MGLDTVLVAGLDPDPVRDPVAEPSATHQVRLHPPRIRRICSRASAIGSLCCCQPVFTASGAYQIGNAAGFFGIALSIQIGDSFGAKRHVGNWGAKIAYVFEEEKLDQNEKKLGLRPQSHERNPRSQSHLNLDRCPNAACASPLSWVSCPLFSSLPSISSEPEPSWPSSQASTAVRAPSAA